MEMRRGICSFLTALTGFLFIVCVSVVITLNLRGIYYSDIQSQQLEQLTGLTETEIRANYDVLIDYNLLIKGVDELELPSFPMSEQGRIHFEEVKQIFAAVQYGCLVFGILFGAGVFCGIRKKDYISLKLTALTTFAIPAVLGILILFCWDSVFVLFHRLFFNNDYWLFDPATDPVILILPDAFFAHCAVAILLLTVVGGVLCGLAYRMLSGKKRKCK